MACWMRDAGLELPWLREWRFDAGRKSFGEHYLTSPTGPSGTTPCRLVSRTSHRTDDVLATL